MSIPSATSSKNVLETLPVFDTLLASISPDNIERPLLGQVNSVIKIDDVAGNIPEFLDADKAILHCHLIGVLAKHPEVSCTTPISPQLMNRASAMALAVEHLNTGDSSVVDNLGEVRRSMCPTLTFTIEYLDTEDNAGTAIEGTVGITERSIQKDGYRIPCSFVGGSRSAITTATALLTGHKGYTEVAGTSTAVKLDDDVQYPLFARAIPSEQDNVIPILTYFTDVLELKYLALIYMNEPYGNSFAEVLARENEKRGPDGPILRRMAIDRAGETIQNTLEELKKSQYSYVLAVMPNTRTYDRLLEAAYDMKLAGNGNYQWYFSDTFQDAEANLTRESLRMAYNGTGMFRPTADRLQNYTNFDDFISQLGDLTNNREDMEFVRNLVSQCPRKIHGHSNASDAAMKTAALHDHEDHNNISLTNHNILERNSTFDAPAFVYDATIAAGISACYAIGGNSDSSGFTGETQYDILSQDTAFNGATGYVNFVNSTGSRNFKNVSYVLTNYVIEEEIGEEGTYIRSTKTNFYLGGEWDKTSAGDFIFTNGMVMPEHPKQLQPTYTDGNPTPFYMKCLAFFFSSSSILLAIGFAMWTWHKRKTRVVMASQPFFLYLVLFGVVLVACSIIPYAFDDETFSAAACNMACGAILWLLFPGLSIVFSALFTKTYRINLIMKNAKKFRRVTVTIRETLLAMGIILTLNIVTLALMTAFHPPKYERKVQFDDQFGRPTHTYGQCVWKDQTPYIIVLFAINCLITLLSAYQSWKARALSTEFAESRYIFATLLITLTLLLVGFPVTTMASSLPEISLFTYSAAVFIFCMVIFGLIFLPKVRFHYRPKRRKEGTTSSTFIGGLASADSQSHLGDKILTTTSSRDLAKQVAELQSLLQEKERKLRECECHSEDESQILED